jgi:uncharacterized membrane protein
MGAGSRMQQYMIEFFRRIEGKFFIAGLCMLLGALIYLVAIFSRDAVLGNKILGMVATEVLAGRSTGLPLGLQQGVPVFEAVVYSILQDLIILYLLAPLVTVFYHRVNKDKFPGWMLERTRMQAEQSKKSRFFSPKFKYAAVLLFIWMPFYMTGTFIGFIVAVLLGIPVKKALFLASFATGFGAVSWAFAFSWILGVLEKTGEFLPALIIGSILGIIVLKYLYHYSQYRKAKKR